MTLENTQRIMELHTINSKGRYIGNVIIWNILKFARTIVHNTIPLPTYFELHHIFNSPWDTSRKARIKHRALYFFLQTRIWHTVAVPSFMICQNNHLQYFLPLITNNWSAIHIKRLWQCCKNAKSKRWYYRNLSMQIKNTLPNNNVTYWLEFQIFDLDTQTLRIPISNT